MQSTRSGNSRCSHARESDHEYERDAAQKTFQEILAASGSANAQMHSGMKTAWDAMQKALEKASSDLRE